MERTQKNHSSCSFCDISFLSPEHSLQKMHEFIDNTIIRLRVFTSRRECRGRSSAHVLHDVLCVLCQLCEKHDGSECSQSSTERRGVSSFRVRLSLVVYFTQRRHARDGFFTAAQPGEAGILPVCSSAFRLQRLKAHPEKVTPAWV